MFSHSNTAQLPDWLKASLAWKEAVKTIEPLSLGEFGEAFFERTRALLPGAKYHTKSFLVIKTAGSPVYLRFARMSGKVAIVVERPQACGWGESDWFRLNFLTANGYLAPEDKALLLAWAKEAVANWRAAGSA